MFRQAFFFSKRQHEPELFQRGSVNVSRPPKQQKPRFYPAEAGTSKINVPFGTWKWIRDGGAGKQLSLRRSWRLVAELSRCEGAARNNLINISNKVGVGGAACGLETSGKQRGGEKGKPCSCYLKLCPPRCSTTILGKKKTQKTPPDARVRQAVTTGQNLVNSVGTQPNKNQNSQAFRRRSKQGENA